MAGTVPRPACGICYCRDSLIFIADNGGMQVHSPLLNVVLHDSRKAEATVDNPERSNLKRGHCPGSSKFAEQDQDQHDNDYIGALTT